VFLEVLALLVLVVASPRSLPTYTVSTPGSQEIQIPLEAMLSTQLAEDLAESGFTSLICKPNRDSAYVLRAPMLHRAEMYDDEAATAASHAMAHLPYHLLASRISKAVASRLPQLRASIQLADELAATIGEYVQKLLGNTGAGAAVSVELQEEPDKQGKRQLDLEIHTGNQLINGADVQLSFFV
jgi:predicted component of type VI protein secretion system